MKRLLTILFTILTLVACNNDKTKDSLTKLEQYVINSDSLSSDSKLFDQIVINIKSKGLDTKSCDSNILYNDSTGKVREQTFQFLIDTTGHDSSLTCSLKITEYRSNRKAAKAFLNIVEFVACCIPDKDIIKLKNFENLSSFKNSASLTLLSSNIVFEINTKNNNKKKKEILALLDSILKNNKYLALDIGETGPAIWTIKDTTWL